MPNNLLPLLLVAHRSLVETNGVRLVMALAVLMTMIQALRHRRRSVRSELESGGLVQNGTIGGAACI